jgi:hypothetical protein
VSRRALFADTIRTVSSGPKIAAALCCLLAGCYTAPRLQEDRSPVSRVQHVFARDFSTSGWLAHYENVARLLGGTGPEIARVQHLQAQATTLASAGQTKVAGVPEKAGSLALSELGRWQRARVPADLEPSPERWATTLADRMANVPRFLRLDRRPMSEPGDLEHRTDPHDERPEATFWERVWRRLQL